MEKILLALDPRNLNTSTVDFACYLARLTRSRLTGVFLEDLNNNVISGTRNERDQSFTGKPDSPNTSPEGQGSEITIENIKNFKLACECREVQTLIHRDRGIPTEEIIEESRFADIIILDPETSFTNRNESIPGRFVKDVLLESECPVIISPYSFENIDEIYLSYNGTKSSVFAIKQFTYLFPELRQKKAIVLSVRSDEGNGLEEQFKMKEWLKNHYNAVEFVLLKGDPSDQLFSYLIERKNGILVMGAYGRGILSRFFKPSHAKLIVKTVNLPIFISHY